MKAKFVYRRIRGRIIRIKNRLFMPKLKATELKVHGRDSLKFKSKSTSKEGKVKIFFRGSGTFMKDNNFMISHVSSRARGQGYGKAGFKQMLSQLNKRGVNKVIGDVIDPSQVKIRASQRNTTFYSFRERGPVSAKFTINEIKNQRYAIEATTDLAKTRAQNKKAVFSGFGALGIAGTSYGLTRKKKK